MAHKFAIIDATGNIVAKFRSIDMAHAYMSKNGGTIRIMKQKRQH